MARGARRDADRAWIVVLVALGACADDPPRSDSDAGPDGGTVGFEPAPPALPTFAPCPAGWREIEDADVPGLVACDPWPAGGPASCAIDEAHFPGGAGCERIGTQCPPGPFADDVVADFFVDPAAAAGGDGSRAAPFDTIARAMTAAGTGDVVALAKGVFDEAVVVPDAVAIVGACVAETVIAPTSFAESAAVSLQGTGGAVVSNLTVGGARYGIDVFATIEAVRLESVLVHQATAFGVSAFGGGEIVAERLVVRDTQMDAGHFGHGLDVLEGSSAEVTVGSFEGGADVGISALDPGSALVVRDVAIRGTEAAGDGLAGYGVYVSGGATVDLERTVVAGNRTFGVRVKGAGTSFATADVVIEDVRPLSTTGEYGWGIDLREGATADLSRTLVRRVRGASLVVQDADSTLVAADLYVHDTLPDAADMGFGLATIDGGATEITRAIFARSRRLGVLVGSPIELLATLSAEDLIVVGTVEGEGFFGGYGLEVHALAVADVVRARFTRNAHTSVVNQLGTLTLEDVLVEGTIASPCEGCGGGVGIAAVGGTDVRRFRLSDNALCGVFLPPEGEADLHEGEISRNAIGINVLHPDYDLARLQDQVVFVDNEQTLDAVDLPLPEVQGNLSN